MEILEFAVFTGYVIFTITKPFIFAASKIRGEDVKRNQQPVITDDVDWDNWGEKPMYPDPTDHGTVDIALNLLNMEAQAINEADDEKKLTLEGKIKSEYKLLLELTLLPIGPPPTAADLVFGDDDEEPDNIIDFTNYTPK